MFDDITSDNNSSKKDDNTQPFADESSPEPEAGSAGFTSQKDDVSAEGSAMFSDSSQKDKSNEFDLPSSQQPPQDMFAGSDASESDRIETPASLSSSPFNTQSSGGDMFSSEEPDSYQSAVDSLKGSEFDSGHSIPDIEVEEGGGARKIILIFIVVLFVAAVVFGIYSVFFKKKNIETQPVSEVEPEEQVIQDQAEGETGEVVPQDTGAESAGEMIQEETVVSPPIDSDLDGLSDEEEKKIGTDPFRADTDNDGLFDNEEVNIYKTNPLIKDTDMDGYIDGVEVRAGYNPKGPGKLFNLNNK